MLRRAIMIKLNKDFRDWVFSVLPILWIIPIPPSSKNSELSFIYSSHKIQSRVPSKGYFWIFHGRIEKNFGVIILSQILNEFAKKDYFLHFLELLRGSFFLEDFGSLWVLQEERGWFHFYFPWMKKEWPFFI